MPTRPQSASQVAANAQARASGTQQARLLGSPLAKRSELLAKLLERGSQPQQIGGYGDLAARLTGQALLQYAQGKTDNAMRAEQSNADLSRRQRLAAAVGGQIEGTPQEVGNGRIGNPLSGLADLFRGGGREQPVEAPTQVAPVQPQAPAQTPTITNTQVPVESPTAPVAPVQGSPIPPVGQAPAPAMPQAPPQQAPSPPQAAQNPLAASPEEKALILRYLNSGDPGLVAQAEQLVTEIDARAAQNPAVRQETQMINGVPYLIDPQTGSARPVFQGGLPQDVQTRDEFNPQGTRSGTLGQRDPSNRLTIIDKPPEGFEGDGGRLRAVPGGPQDPAAGGNAITNERNLRGEFQRDTSAYRDARQGLAKVQAAAADSSGASDVALIFGFMKTLDPTSTVREGEFATAQNTGSIPERIQSAYNRALAGDRLTDTQRSEFVRSAESQFGTYEQGYQRRLEEYIGMAEGYGLNPENVVGRAQQDSRPRRAQSPRQPQPSNAQRAAPPPPPGFVLDN